MSVRPKKHLGQHFLRDKNIAQKIVAAFKNAPTDKILEVGPGKGVLTKYLLQHFGENLFAVEIDKESTKYLLEAYPALKDYLIEEDFLKIDFTSFTDKPFSIIGNFPYNISSQIFFKILDNKDKIIFVIGM